MGEQEVQASWSLRVSQVGPTYCPRACGGRGPGTSVTRLGPPAGPLLESILGQLGSPRGAIQRQGVPQQGLLCTKGALRHLHVKAGEGGVYCILSRALKHSCGVPLGPALSRRRKEAGPSWPGSLIKQLPPGTHRPVAGAPKCAHKPCDPVKVRPRPAGLRARGSGPGGLSACSSASLRVSTTPPRSLHQTLSQLEVAPCVSSPHPRGVAQHLPEGLLRLSEGTAACSEFIYARNSSAESAWTLDKGRLSGMPRGRAADVMG